MSELKLVGVSKRFGGHEVVQDLRLAVAPENVHLFSTDRGLRL